MNGKLFILMIIAIMPAAHAGVITLIDTDGAPVYGEPGSPAAEDIVLEKGTPVEILWLKKEWIKARSAGGEGAFWLSRDDVHYSEGLENYAEGTSGDTALLLLKEAAGDEPHIAPWKLFLAADSWNRAYLAAGDPCAYGCRDAEALLMSIERYPRSGCIPYAYYLLFRWSVAGEEYCRALDYLNRILLAEGNRISIEGAERLGLSGVIGYDLPFGSSADVFYERLEQGRTTLVRYLDYASLFALDPDDDGALDFEIIRTLDELHRAFPSTDRALSDPFNPAVPKYRNFILRHPGSPFSDNALYNSFEECNILTDGSECYKDRIGNLRGLIERYPGSDIAANVKLDMAESYRTLYEYRTFNPVKGENMPEKGDLYRLKALELLAEVESSVPGSLEAMKAGLMTEDIKEGRRLIFLNE